MDPRLYGRYKKPQLRDYGFSSYELSNAYFNALRKHSHAYHGFIEYENLRKSEVDKKIKILLSNIKINNIKNNDIRLIKDIIEFDEEENLFNLILNMEMEMEKLKFLDLLFNCGFKIGKFYHRPSLQNLTRNHGINYINFRFYEGEDKHNRTGIHNLNIPNHENTIDYPKKYFYYYKELLKEIKNMFISGSIEISNRILKNINDPYIITYLLDIEIIISHTTNINFIKYLLENGADLNLEIEFRKYVCKSLYLVIITENIELLHFFVDELHINIMDKINDKGYNALFIAIKHANLDIVQYLIEKGIDINKPCEIDGRNVYLLEYALNNRVDYTNLKYLIENISCDHYNNLLNANFRNKPYKILTYYGKNSSDELIKILKKKLLLCSRMPFISVKEGIPEPEKNKEHNIKKNHIYRYMYSNLVGKEISTFIDQNTRLLNKFGIPSNKR